MIMALNDFLPSNWGRRQLPIRRSDDLGWGLMQPIDRMFDEFFGGGFGLNELNELPRQFVPAVDVSENDRELKISAEIPGMTEKDIDISLANDVLTISGEKTSESEEKGKDRYRMERRYGSFSRSVQLPPGLDTDKAEASYKNGVLDVILPKTAEYNNRVKKITVKGSEEERSQ
jgi:HSP20 family protein